MSPTLAAMFFKDSSLFLSPAHLIIVHFSAVQWCRECQNFCHLCCCCCCCFCSTIIALTSLARFFASQPRDRRRRLACPMIGSSSSAVGAVGSNLAAHKAIVIDSGDGGKNELKLGKEKTVPTVCFPFSPKERG